MGLFDTIYVEKSLPLSDEVKKAFKGTDWTKIDFQTKALDSTMSTYFLKKSGILYYEKVEGNWVDDTEEERKLKKKKYGFYSPGKFVETSRKLVKHKVTAELEFYTSIRDEVGNDWWVEFKCNILDGKLQGEIHSVELVLRRTAEQIEADDRAFRERMYEIERHPWNITRRVLNKVTFGYWKKSWSFFAKGLRKVGSSIDSASFWIFRYM